jgi:peptidoglycan/LPS O-acetylase OafA/YrhL
MIHLVGGAREPAEGDRIGSLDGLRAIAILLVLLYHLTPNHDSNQGLKSVVFKIADIGWSGVDLFFVLSGYLVTGILFAYRQHGRSVQSFFVRRSLRIMPAYYLTLLLVFLAVPLFLGLYEIPRLNDQLPLWLYFSNYIESRSQRVGEWFNLDHFWSLAVEMQFYVLWPLMVYRLPPATVRRLAVGILIAALVGRALLVWWDVNWMITFAWLPWRIDGLAIGSLVALYSHREAAAVARWEGFLPIIAGALGLLILSVAWFGYASAIFKSPGNIQIASVRVVLPLVLSLFYGAILVLALQDNVLSKVLSAGALKSIARYSYGIYIYHYLLIPTYDRYLHPDLLAPWIGGRELAIYSYFAICATISFIVAAASYHLFEVKFLRMKSRY